jgi:hypothetical protein
MKITLSTVQCGHVYTALNRFWLYYHNRQCDLPETKVATALGSLMREFPYLFLAIASGEASIQQIAFLASYIECGSTEWLHASGLLKKGDCNE